MSHPNTSNPVVLVATTDRWYPTARLAMALARAGCTVDVVCPSGHPVRHTNVARRVHVYRGLRPLTSFREAIVAANPDFIIPGDDLSTWHLHQLHAQEQRNGEAGARICSLIERSLGTPESFAVVASRCEFMDLAREQGIRVPKTAVISSIHGLKECVSRIGFPVVLKANGTSGGDGVRMAATLEEAERAFRKLQAPPLLARAAKRALVDQDKTLVWPSLLRRRAVVNAQTFVAGTEATSAVLCWEGRVLASLHFAVVKKMYSAGPATVVRLVDHPEMSAAAETMVRRLKLSGVHGFDFMLEAGTGNAYLIEINPRMTQVGHLTLGPGRDLPAALYAALSGQAIQAAPKVTEKDTIALFPQEWTRDSESAFLQSGFHDVPWEEPALVDACVRKLRKQRVWYSQQTSSEARRPDALAGDGSSRRVPSQSQVASQSNTV